MLAFFLNAAIDQQCERYISEHGLWDEVERRIEDLRRHAAARLPGRPASRATTVWA